MSTSWYNAIVKRTCKIDYNTIYTDTLVVDTVIVPYNSQSKMEKDLYSEIAIGTTKREVDSVFLIYRKTKFKSIFKEFCLFFHDVLKGANTLRHTKQYSSIVDSMNANERRELFTLALKKGHEEIVSLVIKDERFKEAFSYGDIPTLAIRYALTSFYYLCVNILNAINKQLYFLTTNEQRLHDVDIEEETSDHPLNTEVNNHGKSVLIMDTAPNKASRDASIRGVDDVIVPRQNKN